MIRALIKRDLAIAFRHGGGWFYGLVFFAIFTTLSALGLGPEEDVLLAAAPSVVWLAVAFSLLLGAGGLIEPDISDGSLKIFVAQGDPLTDYTFAKFSVQMIIGVLPVLVFSPLAFTMLGDSLAGGIKASAQVLIGAPGLVAFSVFASALGASLRGGRLLAVIVAAPFFTPSLVFGVLSTKALAISGLFFTPALLMLAAISLFAVVSVPWFIVQILRTSLE